MATGPRLSIGQAINVWTCQRFAVHALDPERNRPKFSDGAFRLSNAINVAILDSHREYEDSGRLPNGLSSALEAKVPTPELGHEEAARFRVALDAYEEGFGSDSAARLITIHANAEARLTIPVGGCGVALTGNVRLAFSTELGSPHSGSIEIRSITVGPIGNNETDRRPDALRLAALGASDGIAQRLVVSPTGAAELSTREYDRNEIQTTWRELGEVVDTAMAAGENSTITPGWWCTNCSFVRGCPAISEQRFIDFDQDYPIS
jgi:hypothetical protein